MSHIFGSTSPDSDAEAEAVASATAHIFNLFQQVQLSIRKFSWKIWKGISYLGSNRRAFPLRGVSTTRRLPGRRGPISASPSRKASPRGHPARPPSPPKPSRGRTISQQTKIQLGNLLDNSSQPNHSGRGIVRNGNQCYRIAPLQALLHLPRFVDLLSKHNIATRDGSIMMPHWARAGFTGTHLYDNPRNDPRNFDDKLSKHHPELKACQYCPACIMKTVIRAYWKDDVYDRVPPPPLQDNVSALKLFHYFTGLRSQVDDYGNLKEDDANFCWQKILEACYHCVDTDDSKLWHNWFDALFQIQFKTTRSCHVCGESRAIPQGEEHYLGFDNINIKHDKPDTIESAIRRLLLTSPGEDVPCNVGDDEEDCDAVGSNLIRMEIEAGPEYLCLPLNLSRQDAVYAYDYKSGEEHMVGMRESKNQNPIQFGTYLDLTRHQVDKATPLLYKLQAVILHTGSLEGGHWTATIRTYDDQILHFNDHRITLGTEAHMTANPAYWGGVKYTPATLIYTRLPESEQTPAMREIAQKSRHEERESREATAIAESRDFEPDPSHLGYDEEDLATQLALARSVKHLSKKDPPSRSPPHSPPRLQLGRKSGRYVEPRSPPITKRIGKRR
ncbi:hypothetical protein BDV96DRAFT_642895 [Lophiotrema nucula]|uniref:USP domain-containing protein n=1 Tax=Lophiotrema nucula TaxID=690887 RepID=A0A6A5ZGV2_9PLEO|nr:hypothetical protein BDV96DRAFT_642895 [Lophiotrema nucula]